MFKAMNASVLAAVLLASGAAFAASVPQVLAQQGRLLNTDGTAAAGPVSVVFSIYDSVGSTNALWTETQSVTLTDGYFQVQLGRATPFPADLFNGATRFLGLKVGADAEMTPREELASVPYALVANDAIGDVHPTSVTVNGVQVVKSDGTLGSASQLGYQPQLTSTCTPGQFVNGFTAGTQSCSTPPGVTSVSSDGGIVASIAGDGLSVVANVGTTPGTLAAGDHGHSFSCTRASGTAGTTSTVTCAAGTQLTGGGCSAGTNPITSSYPYQNCGSPFCICIPPCVVYPNAWSCSVAAGSVTAYAVCCNNPMK